MTNLKMTKISLALLQDGEQKQFFDEALWMTLNLGLT